MAKIDSEGTSNLILPFLVQYSYFSLLNRELQNVKKVASHEIIFVWKWYSWIRLSENIWSWTYKYIFFILALNFYWTFIIHCFTVHQIMVTRATLQFYTVCTSVVEIVALDVIGWQVVQLFDHVNNIGGFLHLPLQWGQCDTSRYPIKLRPTYSHHNLIRGRGTHSSNRKQEIRTLTVQIWSRSPFHRVWLVREQRG
jgi:hypothetical protein